VNLSRVAAKQLTASDLTFFAAHFHKSGQRSKQKAINLNADVFVSRFYPGLRDRFAELHFGLTIVGPGTAPPYVLSRKALRTQGAKNWRLDGELINDPPDQAGRFDSLAEGDIAILAFEGSEQPEQLALVLVSATTDAALHGAVLALAAFQGRETMRPLDEGNIRDLLERTRTNYAGLHPLEPLLTADSVEEAIYGPAEAQDVAVRSDGRGVAISPESLRRQATTAGETGQLGEEAFERWLMDSGHSEADFEWVSRTHGRAAYDFQVSRPCWEASVEEIFIDVKATRGTHDAPFHMSTAELRWASLHPNYRIARVSSLATKSADVRILTGVTECAAKILAALHTSLPAGIKVSSVEIPPSMLREVYSGRAEWVTEG
jgi:Domain of unknown function (DUF3883)